MKNKVLIGIIIILVGVIAFEGVYIFTNQNEEEPDKSYINIPKEELNNSNYKKEKFIQISGDNSIVRLIYLRDDFTADEIYSYDYNSSDISGNFNYIGFYDNKVFLIVYDQHRDTSNDESILYTDTYFSYIDLDDENKELIKLFKMPSARNDTDCYASICYEGLNIYYFYFDNNMLYFAPTAFSDYAEALQYTYNIYELDLDNLDRITDFSLLKYESFYAPDWQEGKYPYDLTTDIYSSEDYYLMYVDVENRYKYFQYFDNYQAYYAKMDENNELAKTYQCIDTSYYGTWFVCTNYVDDESTDENGDFLFIDEDFGAVDKFFYGNLLYYLDEDGNIYRIDKELNKEQLFDNKNSLDLVHIKRKAYLLYGYILVEDADGKQYYVKDGKLIDYFNLDVSVNCLNGDVIQNSLDNLVYAWGFPEQIW